MSFTNFNLDPRLLKNVQAMEFETPTPIQHATIPAALTGQDILGSAETGTGKTAAYLLPILHRLINSPRPRRPRVLVLVPTRELALQVAEQAKQLSTGTGLRSVAVYGGVSLGNQEEALRRGVDIVIATPGRLLDHVERRNLGFDDLQVLVLDEADRMLDIGFLPDIRRVVKMLPKERQTLLFSATLQPIINLAYEVTRKAVRVEVEKKVTPDAIEQAFFPVPEHLKMQLLKQLLEDNSMDSVLIFSRTKHRADKIVRDLQRARIDAAVIHGNR
ncbi:MAG: DEAD/DEAH box helicase, partial [Chloroflexi bacterium]|nr:DEAD/DEAH box helicase [Chloroflexota bacterium]